MSVRPTVLAKAARMLGWRQPEKSSYHAPTPGLYHFLRQAEGEKSRLHLRIDPDQRGVLIVNASRVFHLNPTAACMAYLALSQVSQEKALRIIQHSFAVEKSQVKEDYTQFCTQLEELVRPEGACPIHDLDLEVMAPFSAQPSAPYRMDLALTYRCNNDCPHCYNARSRDYAEISTQDWKIILDKLWAVGIPHVVFTGGEPTLRADLPDLIAHAEKNGQITGINTNGRRLSDPAYVESLVAAGLDHVQVTLESHDATIHDRMVNQPGAWKQTTAGIKNALATQLFIMTNTTMLQENSPVLDQTLDFLAETGVPTIGLNALIYSGRGLNVGSGLPEYSLPPLLDMARQKTEARGQRLIWYTPTEYCQFDPMQLDLGVKGCTAALYNMCVESNGDVLPCQSYYQPLGNLLRDDWDIVWNHDLATSLRERRYIAEKCHDCALLPECGGGCPLRLKAVTNSAF